MKNSLFWPPKYLLAPTPSIEGQHGSFLYTACDNRRSPNKTSILQSVLLSRADNPVCLRFKVHMFSAIGWQVVIKGSKRRLNSLLALADIRLTTHSSSHVANCNFEDDLCGYSSASSSNTGFQWFVGSGRVRKPLLKPPVPQLPLVGLSEGLQASKTFAYVDTTVALQGSEKNCNATMSSAVFTAGQNDILLIRYFRKGNSVESFMVYQSAWNTGDQTIKWVPLGSLDEGDDWQDFEAPLAAAAESRIHVVITRSSNQTGFAAVASISVGHPKADVAWRSSISRVVTWTHGQAQFPQLTPGGGAQIILEARVQSGLLAVDDLTATPGPCPATSLCSFEGGIDCALEPDLNNVREWTVVNGSSFDMRDHSTDSTQAIPVTPPFVCVESRKEIPSQARCNFVADCSDGSDERDCGSCSFESSTCGWSVDGPNLLRHDDFSWKRQNAAADFGQMRDHSTNSRRVPVPQPNPGMFICKNKVAVVMEHRCDYIDHCGDLSDEEGCDDYKFRCNFDSSFCDWIPLEASQGGGWTRVKPFQDLARGPTRDHTSGGKDGSFLFLKSKVKAVFASLLGPQLNASNLCVMRFYYTIRGPTNAVLSVKTRITADGEFKEVWKTDRPTDFSHFTEAFVPFHEDSDFEVSIEGSFEGRRNTAGYIAIDDVTFLDSCHAASGLLPKSSPENTTTAPSNCSPTEFSCLSVTHCIPAGQQCDFLRQCPDGSDESHCGACDFSVDMCGLEATRAQSQPRWTRLSTVLVSHNEARFPSFPREDSSHDERGFYAAFLRTDAAHLSVDVVETLRDKDNTETVRRRVLRVRDDLDQVTWKMQAVNVGNRRPGARFYFSAAENVSIDDIEYHHCHPEDTTDESVNCTFETKNGCGWYQENIADSGEWEVLSGKPLSAIPDHTTGHGMYLALENTQDKVVVAHIVSAKLNATSPTGRCFHMWYHMKGDSQSRLTLQVYNASGSGSKLWTKIGHQGSYWIEATININITDASFQLVLEGELSAYSQSIIGVDDISFDEQPCPPTLTCNFEEGPCDWALDGWVVDTGYSFKVVPNDHTTGTSTGNFARLDKPSGHLVSADHDLSLAERRCFRFWHFFTGQREMTLSVYQHVAAPEESRELVWSINGEDRLPRQWLSGSVNIAVNTTASVRLELVGKNPPRNDSALAVDDLLFSGWECPRPGSCTFEDDLCNWRNVGGPKNLTWERGSGPTPDRSGPTADHTVGSRHGYFLLLDAESAKKNRLGVLESELLHYSPKSCLQFYYYVDPEGTQADLSVQYAWRGRAFRHVPVLAKEIFEGWQLFRSVQSDLPATYNIQILGYPGSDDASDIAIDDIEVFDGECIESFPHLEDPKPRNSTSWDCDFDLDFCSWNQSDATWLIRSGRTAILNGDGPHVDSKLRSPEGKYAYYSLKSSSPNNFLVSAPLQSSSRDYCVEFWYFFYSLSPAQLLMGLTNTTSASIDRASWLQQRGFDRTWRRGSFVVPGVEAAGKRLAVHVQQQPQEELVLAEMALDQMRVAPSGTCRHPAGSLCDFEGDGFCGFKVDSTGGGQWRMATGNKQYSDHTFGGSHGGHFLLLHLNEQKPKQRPPYIASLVLPEQSPTNARCLTLWYFMDGTGVGHLNVSVRAPRSTASDLQNMLFGVPSAGWRYGSATVMSASWHEVLLTAEVEHDGSVAVGLNDISLREGQCPEIGYCDFEGPDLCGWENADSDVQRMWVRNRGSTPNSSTGPLADHTLGTRDGTYVYLDGRTKRAEETYTGLLKSQSWIGGSPYCFSLWLHMGVTDVGSSTSALRVIVVYVNEYGKEKREPIIVITGKQEKQWEQKKVTIDLVSSPLMEFRVLIAGKTGGSEGGEIAIDDISVSHGACHESLETQFHCHDGITVVNVSQVCDFKEDCPINGDDEQLCGQCDFDVDTCGWFGEDKGPLVGTGR
ncbi:hypothetical protein MRX96_016529 [Rhipicephalus microplus]